MLLNNIRGSLMSTGTNSFKGLFFKLSFEAKTNLFFK